jgi:hypothetical protein
VVKCTSDDVGDGRFFVERRDDDEKVRQGISSNRREAVHGAR